jgi:hypothetical protein
VALRFGVDAFSENALKLQKKGYTTQMISQNLKDCWEAGIYTEVNWVIGVPGETEADVDEGIELILENRDYIGRLANINPLILVNGSVYWLDPAAHNIEFRVPYEQLLAENPRVVPADKWYSTDPYIDADTRKQRFEKIVLALHEAGFPVGAWANRVIEDVKLARDRNRVGGTEPTAVAAPPDDGRVPRAPGSTDAAPDGSTDGPPALIESDRGYNIVHFQGQYIGLPQRLGPVNLEAEDVAGCHGVFFAATLEEARQRLNDMSVLDEPVFRAASALGQPTSPLVPEDARVFQWEGAYLAVSGSVIEARLGTLDGVDIHVEETGGQAGRPRTMYRRLVELVPFPVKHGIKKAVGLVPSEHVPPKRNHA